MCESEVRLFQEAFAFKRSREPEEFTNSCHLTLRLKPRMTKQLQLDVVLDDFLNFE